MDSDVASDIWRRCSPDVRRFTMIVIDGNPPRKLRPRFNAKTGTTYPDAQQEADEAMTGRALRMVMKQPLEGNLALACAFYRADRHRIDADNMLKHVMDAGNGILWHDDSQVTAVLAVVEVDVERPRTVVCVGGHVSTMDRSAPEKPVKRRKTVSNSVVDYCSGCGKPISRGMGGTCRACRSTPSV